MTTPEIVAIAVAVYMSPSVVALVRRHPSWRDIIALNIFLGWMVLGWIAAAVWSLSPKKPKFSIDTYLAENGPTK